MTKKVMENKNQSEISSAEVWLEKYRKVLSDLNSQTKDDLDLLNAIYDLINVLEEGRSQNVREGGLSPEQIDESIRSYKDEAERLKKQL